MKIYFAYIRVSTVKQGEHGSSLQEQRDAIVSFAARQGFHIAAWFEERETAAKSGRGEFTRMLAALRHGKAQGVIFHKIDRSARNLKDWSAVQDLADRGIDVRFTQESINLGSNEGKLTGDFLAVIASHYIRNLREEVRKGIRGRLKQGFYPLPAPVGYLDQGPAKAKIIDPARGPLIRTAFELYASGGFSLRSLADELYRRGLRSRGGKPLGVNRIAKMLRNPFYVGIIRMTGSGESYHGLHEPIVSPHTFSRVQRTLDNKSNTKAIKHDFLFRRMVTCSYCRYRLVGETKKGHIYYRCHTTTCPTVSVREDRVDGAIRDRLQRACLPDSAAADLRDMIISFTDDGRRRHDELARALRLQSDNLSNRLSRLTDAYLDDAIDRSLFEEKKMALLLDRKAVEEQQNQVGLNADEIRAEMLKFLELAKTLPLSYEMGNPQEKRDFVKSVTSNLSADGKNVVVELRSPFRQVEKLTSVSFGGPLRDIPRTRVAKIFNLIRRHFDTSTAATDREAA
jgi:site-specific DNA recombinase